jgi:hypothetical protein
LHSSVSCAARRNTSGPLTSTRRSSWTHAILQSALGKCPTHIAPGACRFRIRCLKSRTRLLLANLAIQSHRHSKCLQKSLSPKFSRKGSLPKPQNCVQRHCCEKLRATEFSLPVRIRSLDPSSYNDRQLGYSCWPLVTKYYCFGSFLPATLIFNSP